MKRRGQHSKEALTSQFVHAVQAPGFYADGNDLYLRVDASGSKRWVLRTMVQGRRRDIGLGGFSYTSLVEARARARILRKIAREGGDPLAARAQVCRTEYPEVTQARNHAVELRGPYLEKRKGRHLWEILTGDFIYSVQAPGLYADGDGLYLKVDSSGSKRWILRTVVQGKRRDMGLGSCTEISLLEARARARRLRKIARQGGDPFTAREQVFSTCHPEIAQAQRDTVDLLREAGVVVDAFVLTKLGC